MKMYCIICKKNTEQNILTLLPNCTVCGKKNGTFIKNKELH